LTKQQEGMRLFILVKTKNISNIKPWFKAIYILSIVFIIEGCTSTKVYKSQGRVMSTEAKQYLQTHRVTKIPLPWIPAKLSVKIREKLNRAFDAELEVYLKESGVKIAADSLGKIPVSVYQPSKPNLLKKNCIGFYIHGGAFVLGSSKDFLCADICNRLGFPVYSAEYQFSPAAKFPVALNECVEAYKKLVEKFPNHSIVAFGNSAGGNLVLTSMLSIQQQKVKMPKALGLFTPWTDVSGDGDSYIGNKKRDALVTWKHQIDICQKAYIGKEDPRKPLISPIYAEYGNNFPPSMISTGTRDMLLSDCTRLYWKLKKSGIPVELRVWEGMWHGFDNEPKLPEAMECRKEMVEFLLSKLP
jgi:monoterpene epsilon-lactone hydrolase